MKNKTTDTNWQKTKGVVWCKRAERWLARIYRDGKSHYIGSYYTEAEGIEARQAAEKILDVMQPRETVADRRAVREREKVLQQIDDEFEKRFAVPFAKQ